MTEPIDILAVANRLLDEARAAWICAACTEPKRRPIKYATRTVPAMIVWHDFDIPGVVDIEAAKKILAAPHDAYQAAAHNLALAEQSVDNVLALMRELA